MPQVLKTHLTLPLLLLLAAVSFGLFQNCSTMRAQGFGVVAGSSYCAINGAGACASLSAAVCQFNGQAMADGAVVTAYQTSSVASGSTCVSQTRTCHSGALSGSYAFASCGVNQPAACLFNGAQIANGQSVTAYLSGSGSCASQTRACTNGVLSGSYQFASCSAATPASCLFNGQTIANGGSVIAYAAASVPAGGQCQRIQRTCWNGALSNAGDFASCVVNQPAPCTFGGTTLADGQGVTAYAAANVPAGQTCASQTRTCSNGALSGGNAFASCTVAAPAACQINGQTIPDGGSITLYAAPNVGIGQTCAAEVRTCSNGSLAGSATNSGCTVGTTASFGPTTLAGGQSLANGTLTLTMQGDGNLVLTNTAQGRVLWNSRTGNVQCGAGCQAVFQSDGNLVLYNGGRAYWNSGSSGLSNAQLTFSITAPYISVRSNGQIIWAGNTDLTFFGGLSALPDWGMGRAGMPDFMNLFQENSGWSNSLSHLNVFKLYTQQIMEHSNQELTTIFAFLAAHQVALAVEMPPLVNKAGDPNCNGEGVADPSLFLQLAQRIQANGGTLAYVSMDEPVDAMMSQNAAGRQCGFNTQAAAAANAIESYNVIRQVFPAVQYGDIENGLTGDSWGPFVDAWRAQSGVPLAFVHDDALIDTADWQQRYPSIRQMASARNIPYGLIVNGPWDARALDGNSWNGWAIGRMQLYRQLGFAPPDNYQVQSWMAVPTQTLPETSPVTLTFLLNWLFPPTTPAPNFDGSIHLVYRSVNGGGDHLFAGDTNVPNGYRLEGVAFALFNSPSPSRYTLYRCYNASTRQHMMSIDPTCEGAQPAEGVLGYAETGLVGGATRPIWRCINSNGPLSTANVAECITGGLTMQGNQGFVP